MSFLRRKISYFVKLAGFSGMLLLSVPSFSQDSTIYVRLNSNPFAAPYFIFSNTPNGQSMAVTLQKGATYTFIRTDGGHAFNIGDNWKVANNQIQVSSNGTGGVVGGAASIVQNEQLTVSLPDNFSGDQLSYFCYPHSSMIATFNVAQQPTSWDFDGNGATDALTDGLLLMRYAFGLTGEALTNNAIAADAVNSPQQIQNSFGLASNIADIDGNGELDALTDGLLLLRYLFDLRGDALVDSAIAVDASRIDKTNVEAYIDSRMPD